MRTVPFGSFTGVRLALFGSGLLVNLIGFSVYPYLAILLRHRMGLGMDQVGVVLGLAAFVQFAGSVPGAALAERLGLRRSLLMAMALQTLGSLGLLAGEVWPPVTLLALMVRSAATALYSPAVRAYTVHGASPDEQPRLVSASYATGNVGIALGPVVGALFINDPGVMFAAATAAHAALTIGHALLPQDSHHHARTVEPLRRSLGGLAVLPFAVTILTIYLHMHFYQYLVSYAEGRVSTVFYGSAMMGYSLLLGLLQPLLAKRVEQMRYTQAMAVGFGGMALGMIAFADGHKLTIAGGIVALAVGNSVLFLKNVLVALAETPRSAAFAFGHQRLAEGIGAFLGGVVGGALYQAFETARYLPGLWLTVAGQFVLLPALVVLVHRRLRRPATTAVGSR